MKKITFIFSFLIGVFYLSAQSKITFEDNTLNGASAVYGGTLTVIDNPVKTGINASSYCLDVVNDGYAPIRFSNFAISAGTSSSYAYVKLKCKIAYKGYNGGTDLDYPQIDVYASPENPILDATEKLGSITSAWGTHTADSLVWKSVEFTFSSSVLASIPNGTLILKVAKSKCEYLLDDIEVIPSPIYNPNMLVLENFENGVVGDASSYPLYKYWSTTSTVGTTTVSVDPVSGNGNTLKITPTDYNGVINLNVSLPTGKTLNMYDRLYFDLYFNSSNGLYAQPYIFADATMIYQVTTGYPSQGTNAVWNTKDYELTGMPASGSFVLKVGYTSNNSVVYYLDNIKLHLTETITENNITKTTPLIMCQAGNTYTLNLQADNLHILDLNGRKVTELRNVNSFTIENLPHGIYIVKSIVNGTNYISKIIR